MTTLEAVSSKKQQDVDMSVEAVSAPELVRVDKGAGSGFDGAGRDS